MGKKKILLKFYVDKYKGSLKTNIVRFLSETTLHGLKYIVEHSFNSWERLFFLIAFLTAFVTTINFISNVYAKWESTPVIIGVSPHPTSISKIPFPAITICNMNQILRSKVTNYSENSYENAIFKYICQMEEADAFHPISSKKVGLKLSEFLIDHAQPCSKLLLWCKFGYSNYDCSEIFKEVITDEGLCCIFNVLHPKFLYKGNFTKTKILPNIGTAVDWSPENGYPSNLPKSYYPMPAVGTGVYLGLSLILNANIDEYICASNNGPGFKLLLHNPIDSPQIKDLGLSIPLGYETRFRIDAARAESSSTIRSVQQTDRQCLFNNEKNLIYYKYYTRRNCEYECQAFFMLQSCNCIPFNLPLIFENSTECSIVDTRCVKKFEKVWLQSNISSDCKKECTPSCYDLSFAPAAFSIPLSSRNYTIQNHFLQSFDKQFALHNFAVVKIYYRESVFHGDLKNVYIGVTEFLSNTGGIMGLFTGFSFISLVEIVHFILIRPIYAVILSIRKTINK